MYQTNFIILCEPKQAKHIFTQVVPNKEYTNPKLSWVELFFLSVAFACQIYFRVTKVAAVTVHCSNFALIGKTVVDFFSAVGDQ